MTCTDIREQLPLHLYGDLPPDERARVDAHLTQCPACRVVAAEFAAIRRGLNAAPAASRPLEVSEIYRRETVRQRRRARRWQVAAVVGAAAAVLVLFARADIRLDARQLVVRWGTPEP